MLDLWIVGVYLVAMVGVGFFCQKRASRDLDAYFLGGRRIHWLALAMSGAVSNFDITGTMWIVAMLFTLGMKSMWIHWMWGWMLGAFGLAYMGRWVRRSKVMTGAEWMLTRFGSAAAGHTARSVYAFMAVLTQASFIGYAFQGIGKFAAVYLPLSPSVCGILIFSVTTLYVLAGGLLGVVVTDVIQTVILTVAALIIAGLAFVQVPSGLPGPMNQDWFSLMPVWKLPHEIHMDGVSSWFGGLVIAWMMKGLLLNAGGPAQMYDFQRFLAAKTERDAEKVGAAWSLFLIVRWAMAMGIVVLAMNLGTVSDPEQVMPLVLKEWLPIGLRGLVVAGLLSAFMSTFSSTVNSAASYLIRDVLQPLCPSMDRAKTVRAGRWASVAVVVMGLLIGSRSTSISQIWNWMMMSLGAGVVMPNVLRWYWWRLNGWGYTAGTVTGILGAIVSLFMPDLPSYILFPIVISASLIGCVVGSLATKPVEMPVLVRFFETVQPFGSWAPVRSRARVLPGRLQSAKAMVRVLLGIGTIFGAYVAPMYFVARQFGSALSWSLVSAVCVTGLVLFWKKTAIAKDE